MMARLAIPKTYKLYIGGKFPRSESGYTFEVTTPKGDFLANAAQASRKDARDAVSAARSAQSGFAGLTAYNRGQILYRIAEVLEGRVDQFVEEIRASEGVSAQAAKKQVEQSIDTWVWYAGFADKYAQIAGNGGFGTPDLPTSMPKLPEMGTLSLAPTSISPLPNPRVWWWHFLPRERPERAFWV